MKYRTLFILILVVGLLLSVKLIFFKTTADQKAGSRKRTDMPLSVSAFVVNPEKMEQQFFTTGTVRAAEEVELRPETAGKIVSLNLKEGSFVRKGELLVKINDADLQAQLRKFRNQEELAAEQEKRLKSLLSVSGVSREEYEASMSQLNTLKADIDYVLAQIAKTEIRAPFDGIIGLRYVSEGSYVSPAMKIAVMAQVDPVKIDFAVPEKYARVIGSNDRIRFHVEGLEKQYEATVLALEPRVDVATRTVQVRAIGSNKDRKLLPGAFAKIRLSLSEVPDALLVPTEALVPVLKGYKVFISKNNKAQETNVTTGLRTESRVEITEGLKAGDTVITSGVMQLRSGSPVRIGTLK